ncbi:MAG: ADP compounds hydrolase NudE [Succinivibrio sp.]|jgi:ADP-ribose diphosphatase|nr:ADP compounds hydrolase NudE [Succinivibrio sp.]
MKLDELKELQKQVPQVLASRVHKVSRFFTVEELDLRFHNGVQKTYEKLVGGNGAILAVPFDGEHFLMSAEYACGFERYELGFVKGKIDRGETPEQACLRELEEEIGYGFKKCLKLKDEMSVAPGMLSLRMHCFLCTELYKKRSESGDEPEPIELIKVSVPEAVDLVFDPHSPLTESRAIACLALALKALGRLG